MIIQMTINTIHHFYECKNSRMLLSESKLKLIQYAILVEKIIVFYTLTFQVFYRILTTEIWVGNFLDGFCHPSYKLE